MWFFYRKWPITSKRKLKDNASFLTKPNLNSDCYFFYRDNLPSIWFNTWHLIWDYLDCICLLIKQFPVRQSISFNWFDLLYEIRLLYIQTSLLNDMVFVIPRFKLIVILIDRFGNVYLKIDCGRTFFFLQIGPQIKCLIYVVQHAVKKWYDLILRCYRRLKHAFLL